MAGSFTQAGVEMVVKGLQKFNRDMKGAGKASDKLGDSLDDVGKKSGKGADILKVFGTTLSTVGVVAGAATAGFLAVSKAMEFGKEGAIVAQTTESFNRFLASIGKGPEFLDEMSAATNDTVDDMTLMSSTMTLVAGTSDKLGAAMVGAAPKLLQIAKAANKLNPSLGDTAFLYNSLATGIKRNSPLILDNLGLVVKIGAANAAWAKKMGTTVEAMSAEEKQMALLEAALTAGDRMIQQVGGSTDAMGDSFAQAEAKMKNATDQIKASMTPAIADFTETVAEGTPKVADAANQIVTMVEAGMDWVAAAISGEDATAAFNTRMLGTSEVVKVANSQLISLEGSMVGVGAAFGTLEGGAEAVAEALKGQAAAAADEFKASLDVLRMAMKGDAGTAFSDFTNKAAVLHGELTTGKITTEEYTSSIDDLTRGLQDETNAIIYNIAEKQILHALEKGLIADVNASGTAYDEATAALWANAEALGLVDEATLAVMESVQAQTDAFISGKSTADDLAGGLSGLAGQAAAAAAEGGDLKAVIDALKSKTITITTNYRYTGPPPPDPTTGERPERYQHGGSFTVGGPTGVDRTPVFFMATRGEVVTVTPAGQAAAGAGVQVNMGETHIYNDMDEAAFYANVEMAVSRAIQGV